MPTWPGTGTCRAAYCSCGDSSNESALQQQLHCTEASYLCSIAPKAAENGFKSAFVEVTVTDSDTAPRTDMVLGKWFLQFNEWEHHVDRWSWHGLTGDTDFWWGRQAVTRQHKCVRHVRRTPTRLQCVSKSIHYNASDQQAQCNTAVRDMGGTWTAHFHHNLSFFYPFLNLVSVYPACAPPNEAPVWRSLNKQVSGVLNVFLGELKSASKGHALEL